MAGNLDWSLFDDPDRLRFVRGLSESELASSDSLKRLARVGAIASATRFAQISLIGDSQFVPAAHGLTYEAADQHSPVSDSLCSLTMMSNGVFQVNDARLNELTSGLPPVAIGGVVSYLGVPVRDTDGRPVGAICVFDSEPREWLDKDVELISELAELAQRELHMLAALESAGLSDERLRSVINQLVELPKLGNGSILRARAHYDYHAGAPAGGDWIDWSEGPDRISFAIGDVAGHGINSVVVMEELRHAMRAYALHTDDLADTLVRTSALLRHLRANDMATALLADFDPATGKTRFAVAGHPAPLHCRDGRATMVPVEPGPPLGVMTEPPVVAEIVLEHGDRLLLVSDGVFERRNEVIDAGLGASPLQRSATGSNPTWRSQHARSSTTLPTATSTTMPACSSSSDPPSRSNSRTLDCDQPRTHGDKNARDASQRGTPSALSIATLRRHRNSRHTAALT